MFKIVLFLLVFVASASAGSSFLTLSDIHYGSNNSLADGQDTGDALLAMTMSRLKVLSRNVDFIIYLGDLPTHMLISTPKKEEYEETVFSSLYKADSSLKPLFYVTGNNDSLSGNYQPFEVDGKSPLNFAKDWTGACVHCEGLIIDAENMQHGGYYSSYVIPGNKEVILIALNSNQWAKTSFFIYPYLNQEKDAQAQLQWFEKQLKQHKAKQLLIAMHIPPGKKYKGGEYWSKTYLNEFIKLLEQHKNSLGQISLLSSHTHMEEFKRIPFNDKTSIYVYSTPSISLLHHNNPAIKVFQFDKNWRIKDFITYYTSNLSAWGNEQYHALGNSEAIFPNCKSISLSQCLDKYSEKFICERLEQGSFYGVKSLRIHSQLCAINV